MSRRVAIRDTLVEKLKEALDGSSPDDYYNDIDEQVFGCNKFLKDIDAFPAITVTLGPEYPIYQPGGIRQLGCRMYFRVYVRQDDDPEELLESFIQDIKTFIDFHETLTYTITKPGSSDTENRTIRDITVEEVTTDEGLLSPYGIGEVVVTLNYEERNRRF